ncbi:short-chain dehydrogenase, partial [Methylobacterium sp. A54F]
ALQAPAPRTFDRLSRGAVQQQQRGELPRNPGGSLGEPGDGEGHAGGGHPGYVRRRSTYTRAPIHPAATGLLVTAGVAAAAALMRGTGRR